MMQHLLQIPRQGNFRPNLSRPKTLSEVPPRLFQAQKNSRKAGLSPTIAHVSMHRAPF